MASDFTFQSLTDYTFTPSVSGWGSFDTSYQSYTAASSGNSFTAGTGIALTPPNTLLDVNNLPIKCIREEDSSKGFCCGYAVYYYSGFPCCERCFQTLIQGEY